MRTNAEFQLDLQWWLDFAKQYNGISLMLQNDWSEADTVIATDSCLTGCGGIHHTSQQHAEVFHSEFPRSVIDKHLDINCLELLTVLVACRLWAPSLRKAQDHYTM